ncbi:hypothetical protein KAR34_13775, partial [bacterium]|nr:hypothetical protein [bacterium]
MMSNYVLRILLCSALISVVSCATSEKTIDTTSEAAQPATSVPTLAPALMKTAPVTPQTTPAAQPTPKLKPVLHKSRVSSDIVPAGAISETPSGFTSSTEEVFYEEEDLHADTETELKKRLEAKEADEDAELEKEIAQMKAAVQKARAAGSSEAEPTLEPEIEATLPPAPEPITTSFEPEKVFAEPEVISEKVYPVYQVEETVKVEKPEEREKPLPASRAAEIAFGTPVPVGTTASGYQKPVRKEAYQKSSLISILIGILIIFSIIVAFLIWRKKKRKVQRIQVKPIHEERETASHAVPKEDSKVKQSMPEPAYKPEPKPEP